MCITLDQERTITAFARYSECRDKNTQGHLERVGKIVTLLSHALSGLPKYKEILTPKFISYVRCAAMLHDVGKIHISDNILLKPGSLDKDEFETMKYHISPAPEVIKALMEFIQNPELLEMALNIVRYHHENYDGTGYVSGVSGDDIPLEAQITALADVYDAIRSRRCYKEAKSHQYARTYILSQRGKKFSNDIVDGFLVIEDYLQELSYV